MNILIISQYFWPENFRINDLAQELANRGHCVSVLTGLPNYPEGRVFNEYRNNPESYSSYKNVKIYRIPLLPRGVGVIRLALNYISFALMASIFGPWKLRNQKPDVVFTCQLSPVTVGLPAALIARVKGVPMAMWVLDIWPDSLRAVGAVKSPWLLNILGKIVGFIYRRCDLILAQSRCFIKKIQPLAGRGIPVVYLPSWAETIFQPKAIEPAPEVPHKDDTFNVMFAGNIGEAQDFKCILGAAEILKTCPRIRWLIVGDGRMVNWVKNEVKSRGLTESVILLGRYPVERMPEFFVHADAMLVTLSDQEIFAMTIPGKLQSYLAFGLPIIAALNGEGADVIKRANAGLISPSGDSVELAQNVIKMSKLSPAERKDLGRNGLRLSENEFSRDKMIGSVETYLTKMCCGPKSNKCRA